MVQPQLDIITSGQLETILGDLWVAMQEWVMTNVDQSNQMSVVKTNLDSANRAVIGTTGTEKAIAINHAIQEIAAAIEEAGYNIDNMPTSDFAECIRRMTQQSGCYILDTDGIKWNAAEWRYQKQQTGHDPATCAGIFLLCADHDILIASTQYGPMKYGTYGHTVPNLQPMASGIAGTPTDGTYNSRKTMASTTPQYVCSEFRVNYHPGLGMDEVKNKDIVFFESEQQMRDWEAEIGQPQLMALGTDIVYAYPYQSGDITPDGFNSTYWVIYRYQSNTFQPLENIVPYTDSQGVIGCLALNTCYVHKEYAEDTTYWRLPTLYELLMLYLNKALINDCRDALGKANLPAGPCWSCLQTNSNFQYYLSLADGSSNDLNKSYQYWVIPVAS